MSSTRTGTKPQRWLPAAESIGGEPPWQAVIRAPPEGRRGEQRQTCAHRHPDPDAALACAAVLRRQVLAG